MQIAPHVYRLHISENPRLSPMHPGGTNIYFVGEPSEGMVVIDTGEHRRDWTGQILDSYDQMGRPKIDAILVSHGHRDHIGGVDRVQDRMQCPVRCHPRLVDQLEQVLGPNVVVKLKSREPILTGGGVRLRALFTPGHSDDHVCYYLPGARIIFTGDTILGASSTTVQSLYDYMSSLELLARHRPKIICPGHGPVVTDGLRYVEFYIRNRLDREQKIVEALKNGSSNVDDIVKTSYPSNLRRELKAAAGRNVLTHLAKLKHEGRVEETASAYRLTDTPL